jgi:hypothetical protein
MCKYPYFCDCRLGSFIKKIFKGDRQVKNFNTAEEQRAFEDGVEYAKRYIAFCMKNYTKNLLERPCPATCEFQFDLCYFIRGLQYIPNKANVTFKEFCENY